MGKMEVLAKMPLNVLLTTKEIKASMPADSPEHASPGYVNTSLRRLLRDGVVEQVGTKYRRVKP